MPRNVKVGLIQAATPYEQGWSIEKTQKAAMDVHVPLIEEAGKQGVQNLGLQEIFRRLNRNPRLFAGEGAAAASPLKFGVHGPRIDAGLARIYHQLMNDVASMLVLASQNAFDIMCAVEDGEIVAPEPVYFGFGEQQDRLNKLVQERASLKTLVETGLDVANALQALVAEFKKYKVDGA